MYEHELYALSFVKRGSPSAATRPVPLWLSREPPASALGELMVTIRASPPDQCPHGPLIAIILFGSQVISLVRLAGLPAFHSVHPRRIRSRSQHQGMGYHPPRMKIRWGCPPWVLSPVDSHACPGSHEYRA